MSISFNIHGIWRPLKVTKATVRLYRYGVLYEIHTLTKGDTLVLPEINTIYDEDLSHYGWTTTYGATSRSYTSTASVVVTEDMNLYAVFSYISGTSVDNTQITINSTNSGNPEIYTVAEDGDLIISGYTDISGIRTEYTLGTCIKINGEVLSGSWNPYGSMKVSVKAGDIITVFKHANTGSASGVTYFYLYLQFPREVQNIGYRSAKVL